MWALHLAAGIEVEPHKEIFDQWGRFVARGDLWLVGTRRIHEYDGDVHRDRQTHRSGRDRRLVEIEWQRMGFTSYQLLNEAPPSSPVPTACSGGAGIRSDFARWAALLDDSPFRSADAPNSRAAGNERSQTAGERQFCRTKCVTRPQLLRMSMSG